MSLFPHAPPNTRNQDEVPGSKAKNHAGSSNAVKKTLSPASSSSDESMMGSPDRSSLEEKEIVLSGFAARSLPKDKESAVHGFSIKSPEKEKKSKVKVSCKSSVGEEAMIYQEVKSPPRTVSSREEEPATRSPVKSPKYERENSFYSVTSSSHHRSPSRDLESQISSPMHKNSSIDSPNSGTMTVGSILLSPIGNMPVIGDPFEKVTSPMFPMASRMVSRETTSTSKVGQNGAGRDTAKMEESLMSSIKKLEIGLRFVALVFCLASFSSMAANKTYGWDGDSFDRYTEFRYCLSTNVIASAYSLFQVLMLLYTMRKRPIMNDQISCCFDLFMDQILAYLLMSASSSAASRNGAWVADFGSDKFTKKMNGAIALSFLAFFALAFSSIISTYKFVRRYS